MRRVMWSGNLGTLSADRLTQLVKLRIVIDPTIPTHGERRVLVSLTRKEAEALICQLQSLVDHL